MFYTSLYTFVVVSDSNRGLKD